MYYMLVYVLYVNMHMYILVCICIIC